MPVLTRLDECLPKRDGHLFIEDCNTLDLVWQFGSPIFVLSEDQIRRNARHFHAAFQQGWPKPTSDTTYTVDIQSVKIGGQSRSFTYDVIVFDPAP